MPIHVPESKGRKSPKKNLNYKFFNLFNFKDKSIILLHLILFKQEI